MDICTAHGHFARRQDRSICDVEAVYRGMDVWPAYMVACVSLAGMLDEAQTDEDLDEAVAHYRTLIDIGIAPPEALQEETLNVLECFMAECERLELVAMGAERD